MKEWPKVPLPPKEKPRHNRAWHLPKGPFRRSSVAARPSPMYGPSPRPEPGFSAFSAQPSLRPLGVAAFAQNDYRSAAVAPGRLVGWRVCKLLEVVLVGAAVDVHLRLEVRAAPGTILPRAAMAFGMVVPAEGVAPVVSETTVPGVGEQHVIVLVVADPLITAGSADEPGRLAAKTAEGLFARCA